MKTTLTALTMGAALSAALPAVAEYPTRAIQMIIPFGPGGATDLSARALSTPLSQIVPQPLVLTNRAGAGGATGSVAVRDAEADGYTLLLARVGSHTVNPAMNPNLPYTLEEFRFIGVYEINPVACVVRDESEFQTLDDLINAVQERPGTVLYSSSGVGSLPHFGALMVLDAYGIGDLDENVIHIPTEGDGQGLTAVLQGTADFFCGSTSPAAPFIASGQMRPLMVTSPNRLEGFDAPTVHELGKPELAALVGWTGLAGPAGIPDDVVEKWGEWLAEAVQDEDFNRFMTTGGSIVELMSPEESVAFVNDAYEIFRRLVVTLNLEIQ